jgi:thioredoxin reductase (NADPH)
VSETYDTVVAGGGIAGMTAAMAAAQLGRRTLVLTGDVIGGQLLSIEKVEGFPGHPDGIPGYDLCPMAQEQANSAGAEFVPAVLQSLQQQGETWRLVTGEGEFSARAVIIATGSSLKELGVPGEARLRGKGVSHCATCDGPLLRNRVAAVIGGGDSAMQEALTLAQFAQRVLLLNRGAALTGQAAYRDRIAGHGKIEVRHNTTVEEVLGDATASGVRIRDGRSNTATDLECSGVFVYIGLAPNSAPLHGLTALDASGQVLVDQEMRTVLPGLCAVGTVRSGSPGRAVSSAGDGASAAIAADRYLADGTWRR